MSSDKKSKTEELTPLRDELDGLDGELLQLLAKRRELSRKIVDAKVTEGIALRDRDREEDLLSTRVKSARNLGLDAHYVTKLFHSVIEDSLRIQSGYIQEQQNVVKQSATKRVACLGGDGSYSSLAARRHFSAAGEKLVLVGQSNFESVIRATENGEADYAILPIENTTSGSINEVYDLLLHTKLSIVAEERCVVDHCLCARSQVDLSKIKTIYSHPQPIMQCSKFLTSLSQCQIEYTESTAHALQRASQSNDESIAAILSEEVARENDLVILKREISNRKENFTRFIIASLRPVQVDSRIPCKTSLVLSTLQKPGALVEALLVFRNRGLNLTKLESRPMLENAWEEMFYLDFEGNIIEDKTKQALDELANVTRFLKVLGSYPAIDLPPTEIPVQVLTQSSDDKGSVVVSEVPAEKKSKVKAKGYKLASREHKSEDTIIDVRGVKLGGPDFVVIAGPCSVESVEQIMSCAREAKENGAKILRGGCFKPRSSPYSFQGLGYEGLDMLADAGRWYGLPVITEVLAPEDVTEVARNSDILQVGARNMQNFSLLKAVGQVHRPVMLKRGLMSSLEELLQAAEYILAHGNQQVFLCERGIRTFETATRNTLDLSAVPVLKQLTHLPVFVDPSHAAGERDLVPPLAVAAKAVGAHGIMVEFHPEPEKALSDGPQALRYPQFEKLMRDLYR